MVWCPATDQLSSPHWMCRCPCPTGGSPWSGSWPPSAVSRPFGCFAGDSLHTAAAASPPTRQHRYVKVRSEKHRMCYSCLCKTATCSENLCTPRNSPQVYSQKLCAQRCVAGSLDLCFSPRKNTNGILAPILGSPAGGTVPTPTEDLLPCDELTIFLESSHTGSPLPQ